MTLIGFNLFALIDVLTALDNTEKLFPIYIISP